jgi:hypothetical protein
MSRRGEDPKALPRDGRDLTGDALHERLSS